MANCAVRVLDEVLTAFCEKCETSPVPARNPSTIKEISTVTLMDVSVFCTRAARCTPKIFRTVKTSSRAHAAACAGPNVNVQSPEPNSTRGCSCLNCGKKEPRYPENTSAAGDMGAEK